MKRLNDSLMLRTTRIRNRICVPPMVIYHWSDGSGTVSDRHVAHYQEIARGGPGLIIQEATCIASDGRLTETQLGIWSDEHISGLRRITEAVHAEGCPILVQIHHAGVVGIAEHPLCPDAYCWHGKTGCRMTEEDIARVQQEFVDAAKRAVRAGYDGVELHGCHAYLMSQFLNQRVNRRDDGYGTQPERFVLEVLQRIRAEVSAEFIVGIRLGGFEPTLEDGLRHAVILERGGIDFLDISYGFSEESEPFAAEGFPCKDIIYAAAEVRKRVGIPVFAVNGIRTRADACRVLEAADVDMVDIGRSTLANPNWAAEALAGKEPARCLDCAECQWRVDPDRCAARLLRARRMTGKRGE